MLSYRLSGKFTAADLVKKTILQNIQPTFFFKNTVFAYIMHNTLALDTSSRLNYTALYG